eukprot:6183481-Pleurochrysis_carterae.AAC.6
MRSAGAFAPKSGSIPVRIVKILCSTLLITPLFLLALLGPFTCVPAAVTCNTPGQQISSEDSDDAQASMRCCAITTHLRDTELHLTKSSVTLTGWQWKPRAP